MVSVRRGTCADDTKHAADKSHGIEEVRHFGRSKVALRLAEGLSLVIDVLNVLRSEILIRGLSWGLYSAFYNIPSSCHCSLFFHDRMNVALHCYKSCSETDGPEGQ